MVDVTKAHAIVLYAYAAFFALVAFDIDLPVTMKMIDKTYFYTNALQLILSILAVMFGLVAFLEFSGIVK